MSDEMVFDSPALKTVPVRIGEKRYVLMEADGEAAAAYENATFRARRYDADGRLCSFDGLADAEPLLVHCCLFECGSDGKVQVDKEGKPMGQVPLGVVKSLPSRVVKALFDRVREISGMNAADSESSLRKQMADLEKKLSALRNGDTAKNSHAAMPVGGG